jgi:hypothetical protein
MKKALFVSCIAILLTIYNVHALPQMTVTPITTNGSGVYAINDLGHVAYKGTENGDFQIYLYKNGASTKITSNNHSNNSFIDYVKINNSDQIVWTQYDYSVTPLQINVYLYSSGSITKINTLIGTSQNVCINPQINNNGYVVWQQYNADDGVNNGSEIFLYNGSTIRITNDANKDVSPMINDNNVVVWTGDRRALNDWDQRVFQYNNGSTSALVYSAGSGSYSPLISTNNAVAYIRYNSASTISYYTLNLLSGGQTTQIAYSSYNGRPFDFSNGKVIFSDKNKKMYLFNGTDTIMISTSVYDNNYPSLNASGHAAWMQSDANNNYARIVYYNGISVDSISSYGSYGYPVINSINNIVWCNDGSTIYLAQPISGIITQRDKISSKGSLNNRTGIMLHANSRSTVVADFLGRSSSSISSHNSAAGVYIIQKKMAH